MEITKEKKAQLKEVYEQFNQTVNDSCKSLHDAFVNMDENDPVKEIVSDTLIDIKLEQKKYQQKYDELSEEDFYEVLDEFTKKHKKRMDKVKKAMLE